MFLQSPCIFPKFEHYSRMMMKMSFSYNSVKFNFFFLISFICLSSCNQDKRIDVDNIKVDLRIERFDRDLVKVNPDSLASQLPVLEKKYGAFYHDYFGKILNLGSTTDTGYYPLVRQILTGTAFKDLQHETDSIFKDLKMAEPSISEAFKHIKYYYPQQKVPKIVTYISGFQIQTPIGVDYVGIGLDMFLGTQSKFYPALVESIPRYISRRFTPDNIAPRIVEVITREELFPEPETQTLLDKMIYQGKSMYFMKAVQPNLADSTIIGYSKQQMDWATQFESDIWAYFLEENLLYESDYLKIQKYLSEAPFTPGLGSHNDSAPKLGIYTGWQIVKNYMKNNPEVTLQDLMKDNDYQKILKRSKYRPEHKQ